MTNTLHAGEQLTVNGQLLSTNGKLRLVQQGDGNLVLYRTDNGAAIWASNTAGRPVTRAVMQGDGNFVCYDGAGHAYFDTGTWNHSGSWIVLQDDGNLVVYAPSGAPLWSSNTWINWNPQTRAQLVLRRLSCADTTEVGHDEVYYLFAGVDGAGKTVSHRGPDLTQGADADNQSAWDMNDSGSVQSRAFNVALCNEAVATGQTATFGFGFAESDGQDWASTVKAASDIAAKLAKDNANVQAAAAVVGLMSSFIPKNQDDVLGGFGLTVGNDGGQVVVRELAAGSYTTVVHPLDPRTGTFTLHFQHDDGDYTADFELRGI